jgi:hypothetical protein
MLSNFDLENILKTYNVPVVSVCMKDELPNKVVNGNYIINLQSSTAGKGTHWLGLIIKNKESFFFDSFGAPPSQEIIDFVKKRKGCKLAFNNWIIQSLESENCGYFVSSFLIYMNRHLKNQSLFQIADDYIDGYVDDTKTNDKILKHFFIEYTKGQPIKLIKRLLKEKDLK